MKIFTYVSEFESEIDASPGEAWASIADFSRYPEWNPLAPKLHGNARAGSLAAGWLKPGLPLIRVPFFPRILTADAERELRWKGGVPLIFSGDHRIIIDREAGATKIVHHETFRGLIVPPLRICGLRMITRRLYRNYNRQLEAHATGLLAADTAEEEQADDADQD